MRREPCQGSRSGLQPMISMLCHPACSTNMILQLRVKMVHHPAGHGRMQPLVGVPPSVQSWRGNTSSALPLRTWNRLAGKTAGGQNAWLRLRRSRTAVWIIGTSICRSSRGVQLSDSSSAQTLLYQLAGLTEAPSVGCTRRATCRVALRYHQPWRASSPSGRKGTSPGHPQVTVALAWMRRGRDPPRLVAMQAPAEDQGQDAGGSGHRVPLPQDGERLDPHRQLGGIHSDCIRF